MRISDWSSDVCSSDLQEMLCERKLSNWVSSLQPLHSEGDCYENPSHSCISRRSGCFDASRSASRYVPRSTFEAGHTFQPGWKYKIGRESCRERVCQYV